MSADPVSHPVRTVEPMTTTEIDVDELEYPVEEHDVTSTDLHLSWIFLLRENLRRLLAGPDCYVGGDMFWYPVQGHPEICASPDAFVVFGRPFAPRETWKNWREDGIGPQVTIEVLSKVNKEPRGRRILADKVVLYEAHGVDEYVELDPLVPSIEVWLRGEAGLVHQGQLERWRSGRLGGVTFAVEGVELVVRDPYGQPFPTLQVLADAVEVETLRADAERARADGEQARADGERARADGERARADRAEAELAALRARLTGEG
jgi:Uma2 family endonuclease